MVEIGVNNDNRDKLTQSAGLVTSSQSRQTDQRVKQLPNPKHEKIKHSTLSILGEHILFVLISNYMLTTKPAGN